MQSKSHTQKWLTNLGKIPSTPLNIVGEFENRCHHYVKVLVKNPTLNYNEHEKAGGDFPKNANGVLVLKRKWVHTKYKKRRGKNTGLI